jgi:hypothetical protein
LNARHRGKRRVHSVKAALHIGLFHGLRALQGGGVQNCTEVQVCTPPNGDRAHTENGVDTRSKPRIDAAYGFRKRSAEYAVRDQACGAE